MPNENSPDDSHSGLNDADVVPVLTDAERAMLDNTSTLRRLAIIAEAVDFELDLQVKRKEELEQARNNIEEELAHVDTIVVALEWARDGIKDTVTEIEAAEQAAE